MNCGAPDCLKNANRAGLCDTHRGRLERLGAYELPPKFSTGPLVQAVADRGGLTNCGAPKGSRIARRYYDAIERGSLSAIAADELAAFLFGKHPAEIWGDWAGES